MGKVHSDSLDALLSENARLNSQLNQFKQMLDAMPAMLYTSNNDKKSITWCNRTLTDTMGYTLDEIKEMGMAFFQEILHPEDFGVAMVARNEFSNNKEIFGGILRVKGRHDKNWKWLVGLGIPYTHDDSGSLSEVICVFLDFSFVIDTSSQISEALREVLRRSNEDVLNKLTAREKDIFILAAQGNNNKEIAQTLNLSRYTIETHRKNIRLKLKVRNTSELVALAKQIGFQ
ncbi:LuxR C-terminal-related transcriptional regulator [Chitinophaga skermanii]|nr:LuxR C-terminal-related transcriptional regulator [Chitinophaga skermanii]